MKKITKKMVLIVIPILAIIVSILSFSKYTFAASQKFKSINDIIPSNRKVKVGNEQYYYIFYEDLINIPNIICTTKGLHIPRESCTIVKKESGKYQTDTTRTYTDSSGKVHRGKKTGYLTASDFADALALEREDKPFEGTAKSETYLRAKILGTYNATPAEAWVLSETSRNSFNSTGRTFQYKLDKNNNYIIWARQGDEKAEELCINANKVKNTNGITIWAVDWDDDTDEPKKFVTLVGTIYYEMVDQDQGENYSEYTYVQHAWWKVNQVGFPNLEKSLHDIQTTDLEYEAKDFERYIAKVADSSQKEPNKRMRQVYTSGDGIIGMRTFMENVKGAINWQWNDDHTIKLDKDKLTPKCDTKELNLSFDAVRNQYIIGPITLDYVREATQQGYRPKVEFSGITDMQLYGLDINGNRLLDTNKESALQLKTAYRKDGNYEIIYSKGAEGHKSPTYTRYIDGKTETAPIDREGEYPFPYPGEEFYIAVNYLDDMVAIESLEVKFKYMNAGAQFEYLSGTYYEITWAPVKEKIDGKYSLEVKSVRTQSGQDMVGVRDNVKELIDATASELNENPGITTNVFDDKIELSSRLAGTVWIDELPQKSGGQPLGTKESNEKPAPANSVEIIVWKVKYDITNGLKEISREKAIGWKTTTGSDNKEVRNMINFIDDDKRLYIDGNGNYQIKVPVPSEEKLDTQKYRMVYDVQFVYDGQTYEGTEYLKSAGTNDIAGKTKAFTKTAEQTKGKEKDYTKFALDSYAVENAEERNEFDKFFTEIYGDSEMNPESNKTKGKATGSTYNNAIANNQFESIEYDGNNKKEIELDYNTIDGESGVNAAKKSELITTSSDGKVLNQFKHSAYTSEGGMVFPYEALSSTPYYHCNESNYDNFIGKNQFNKTFKPTDEYFTQINLGLVEREKVDISVLKDLYKAKVVVNEQETDYTYNSWGELTAENLKQTVSNYRDTKYTIGLYNSDYSYRSSAYDVPGDVGVAKQVLSAIKDESELRLFVTYRIAIYNESEFSNVSINEFKDYYNNALTLVGFDEVQSDGGYSVRQDEDGNYIGNIGVNKVTTSEQGSEAAGYVREEKVIADIPYYRKVKADADLSQLFKWNKKDDCDTEKITGISAVGEIKKGSDSISISNVDGTDFKCATVKTFNAIDVNSGTINKNAEDFVLAPSERLEVFVTYEVDQARFKEIQEAKKNNTEEENQSLTVAEETNEEGLREILKNVTVTELSRYSTIYTKEQTTKHATVSIKEGNISGRIDHDSAPDNIIKTKIDDVSLYEDDSQGAPILTIGLKDLERREINGVVWDDYRNDKEEANGIYNAEDGDKPIQGVNVTLVEKISITPDDLMRIKAKNNDTNPLNLELLDYEFEYIWPDGSFNLGNVAGEDGEFKSRVVTDSNGEYKFSNMVAGNYVVRFEYGNNENTIKYNGQDYKNTAYQAGMMNISAELDEEGRIVKGTTDGLTIKDGNLVTLEEANLVGKRTTLNNQWHDLSNNTLNGVKTEEGKAVIDSSLARVSDARDYEPRRLQVNAYSRTITNKNAEVLASGGTYEKYYENILDTEEMKNELMNNTSMVANTAKIAITIEPQSELVIDEKTLTTTVDGKIQTHDYKVSQIDFGLVRRPETRLNIQKEISKIELMKNDDSEVILSVSMDEEGNIIKSENSVNADKVKEIRKTDLNGTQGFKYVDIESSILEGARLELAYNIRLYNNSEDDYTTELLAKTKNIQELYDLATQYESTNYEHKIGEQDGLSPYSTGKGIIYGEVVGLHYYTNGLDAYNEGEELDAERKANLVDMYNYEYDKELKVTTTVDQLVDYVDNDLSINIEATTGIVNQSWDASTSEDRENKLSAISYINNEKTDNNLLDNKGRKYVDSTNQKNNIVFSKNELMGPRTITYTKLKLDEDGKTVTEEKDGKILPVLDEGEVEDIYTTIDEKTTSDIVDMYNPQLTKELLPGENVLIKIITSQGTSGQNMNNMNYDNLVEIAMYSNTVGRRDILSIPGNANVIAKELPAHNAGYDRVNDEFKPKQANITVGNELVTVNTEPDAYAAKDTVIFSEPTGLSLQRKNANTIIRIILLLLIIAAVTIISAIIVMVLKKTKTYDDKDLTE